MASSTDNVKLGVCTVIFDGVDLGYTKGGVEVTVSTETHEVTVDQFGSTPIGELINGRQVMAKCPLAETTIDNLALVMPGATIVSDGTKATGTVTFVTTPPVNNDSVTINGVTFTFRTVPLIITDLAIPATIAAAAIAFAAAVNANPCDFKATAAAGIVTLTNRFRSALGNVAFTKVGGANITLVGATGGVNATRAKVVVTNGVGLNMLTLAKTLVLRPRGTTGSDDFVIFKAMCPGAMNFSFNTDAERIFNSEFKGYIQADGTLFSIGDQAAV